jgi:hypothetical protein
MDYQAKYEHLRECMILVANGLKESKNTGELGDAMLETIACIDKK